MKICLIENCGNRHHANGLCNKHNSIEWRKHQKITSIGKGKYKRPPLIDRFLNKININDGCWLWVGAIQNAGYGVLRINGKLKKAHRISYELFIDKPDDNLVLDHLCEIKQCVNPFHLEQVTNVENIQRAAINRSGGANYCINGHDYSINPPVYYYGKYGKQKKCPTCNRENVKKYRKKH